MNNHKDKFAICIGRQLASGGRAVGRMLAERLGAEYYDREILDIAARESGMCREVFEQNDERKGIFGAAFRSMSSLIGMNSAYSAQNRNIELFALQANAIQKAADEGNCIFIGRAADYILREHTNCLSVFISADEEDRIDTLCKDRNMEPGEARHLIEKVDSKRADFYNFFSGKKWGAARSYDICINTSRTGIEGAAAIIEMALDDLLKDK